MSECGASSLALLDRLGAQRHQWPRGAMIPIFRDLCPQPATTYLELCELSIGIQIHTAMPGVYGGWGCLRRIRNIDCFITQKTKPKALTLLKLLWCSHQLLKLGPHL